MKVILLEDVKSLGKKGQVVDINDGYARNYVLPKKLGIEANNKNLNDLKLKNANDEKIAREQLEAAKVFAAEMEKDEVVVSIKAGEGGRTFGSVSSKEIATAYKEQCGKEIDKKKIQLTEAIKNFGVYEVSVKVHPKVTGKLKVKVTELK
ncbi:MAG: 50S ribosomal protein L9 [Lachnospiraceae bacterium]|nr:50S ribosomal protein L9 [Lachnospiraceae bacterium]MCI7042512.1 50S ribosomal protein L9 [Lachnospiraceae bacterium]MCI7190742.1 50S ribosomal protein L9 [Lachnospiraceae bacterium]MDD7627146.1 50S ribosomal protein L9 [Lachnospiraceae bacterium]MDY4118436.1 50S ribosomal protein L9 [Lachnospiraceae bacterium]